MFYNLPQPNRTEKTFSKQYSTKDMVMQLETNLCIVDTLKYHKFCSSTVLQAESDSDILLCLLLLCKTLTCTLHLSLCEWIDQLCINPILRIGLIHM